MIGNTKGLSYTCKGISNGHNVIVEKFFTFNAILYYNHVVNGLESSP